MLGACALQYTSQERNSTVRKVLSFTRIYTASTFSHIAVLVCSLWRRTISLIRPSGLSYSSENVLLEV